MFNILMQPKTQIRPSQKQLTTFLKLFYQFGFMYGILHVIKRIFHNSLEYYVLCWHSNLTKPRLLTHNWSTNQEGLTFLGHTVQVTDLTNRTK